MLRGVTPGFGSEGVSLGVEGVGVGLGERTYSQAWNVPTHKCQNQN